MKIKNILLFMSLPLAAAAQEVDTLWNDGQEYPYYYEEPKEDYIVNNPPPYQPAPLAPMAVRSIKGERWDEATQGLDYSKDRPKPPREKKQRDPNVGNSNIDWTSATQWLGNLLQTIAILAAAVAIAFGIWRMLRAPRNRQIARDGVEITLDNLDTYLHESDLDRFLREALGRGNYTLAVRISYLRIIKNLSEQNALKWSPEKTNRDYLREMRGHSSAELFREATRIYEQVWYGNQPLSAAEYERLAPRLGVFQ
ncbi:MAG: DUF4129 domain-containing protein [Saprospiraceae bacterium]|nr:DUF4129 domain-containing protein [Saprospiraceae bacterium]